MAGPTVLITDGQTPIIAAVLIFVLRLPGIPTVII